MNGDDAMHDRVERLEDELFRTSPENPGAILRLDRIERLLSVMLKVGYVLGGFGLTWKAFDVVGEIFRKMATP
jgi:hypothetical protein